MHAVLGELVEAELALEDLLGRILAQVDAGDAVVRGDLLMPGHAVRQLALLVGLDMVLHQRVEEHHVGRGIAGEDLPHDAFHRRIDLLLGGVTVVDGELDEDQRRPAVQGIAIGAKRAQPRSGAADGRVVLRQHRAGIILPQLPHCQFAVALFRLARARPLGDRSAEERDLGVGCRLLALGKLAEGIRAAAALMDIVVGHDRRGQQTDEQKAEDTGEGDFHAGEAPGGVVAGGGSSRCCLW